MDTPIGEPSKVLSQLIENIEKIVIGKREAIEYMLIALLCNGHVLIEDVPGVAKTVLARSLARSIRGRFSRIQFTPDLYPADIIGVEVWNQKEHDFQFRRGPIFANIVLADEINRAQQKTQSALLEAMEEQQVTVYNETYELKAPFLVLATQNPIEYEGTFPLPEAQMDRFLLRIAIGYPDAESEHEMLRRQSSADHPVRRLEPVVGVEEIALLQTKLHDLVYIDEMIRAYIIEIVQATRRHDGLRLGASPRGSLALEKASKARALLRGRDFVRPEDIQALAGPVLMHRLILKSDYARGKTPAERTLGLVQEILSAVPEPGKKKR